MYYPDMQFERASSDARNAGKWTDYPPPAQAPAEVTGAWRECETARSKAHELISAADDARAAAARAGREDEQAQLAAARNGTAPPAPARPGAELLASEHEQNAVLACRAAQAAHQRYLEALRGAASDQDQAAAWTGRLLPALADAEQAQAEAWQQLQAAFTRTVMLRSTVYTLAGDPHDPDRRRTDWQFLSGEIDRALAVPGWLSRLRAALDDLAEVPA
jgi:hypothetical protein